MPRPFGTRFLAAGAALALVGSPFPRLDAERLDGQPLSLPGAFGARPGVVVAGFSAGAGGDVERWARWVGGELTAHGHAELAVVVVVEAPAFIAGLVASGLRRGRDGKSQALIAVKADPDKTLRHALGVRRDRHAQVLLVGADGRLRWRTDAGFSTSRAKALRQALD